MAGVAGWLATFPLDVVKTRIQGSDKGSHVIMPHQTERSQLLGPFPDKPGNPYSTVWSTIVHSYRTDGIGVFFRGLAPTLIRYAFHQIRHHVLIVNVAYSAIPVNMATFAVFEMVVHILS